MYQFIALWIKAKLCAVPDREYFQNFSEEDLTAKNNSKLMLPQPHTNISITITLQPHTNIS